MIIIYKIHISDLPNKFYIGATTKYQQRIKAHNSLIRNGKHFNISFQEAYDISKTKKLIFEIVCECNQNEMFQKEHDVILENGVENCYNILVSTNGFGDILSHHPNKEQIKVNIKNGSLLRVENLTKEQKEKASENSRGSNNGNWKGGISKSFCTCGNEKALTAVTCSKCRNRSGSNNPFFGKKHSTEIIDKIKETKAKNPFVQPINSRKVIINEMEYASATYAAKILKCAVATVLNRCNSDKFVNYIFI